MLPRTSDQNLNILILLYNRLAAGAHPSIPALNAALDDIEPEAGNRLAGREFLNFMIAFNRERERVGRLTVGPPIAVVNNPAPVIVPPTVVPPTVVAPVINNPTPVVNNLAQPVVVVAQPKKKRHIRGQQLAEEQEERWEEAVAHAKVKCADFVVCFQKGKDLIYGLADGRKLYILALDATYDAHTDLDYTHLRVQPKGAFDFLIIDTFNNAFLGTEVMATACSVHVAMKTSGHRQLTSSEANQSQTYLGHLPNEDPNVQSFRDFLEQDTAYDLKTISANSNSNMNLRYGRACKAGMAYAITVRAGRIHFVLDCIDWKRFFGDVTAPHDTRQITGKELRWLFRHRENPQIKTEVYFWLDGKRCHAPWEEGPSVGDWQKYQAILDGKGHDFSSGGKTKLSS